VAVFPEGKRVASCGSDKTACIWTIENRGCEHTLMDHTESVEPLAFSPDGKRVVTVGLDKTAIIWSVSLARKRGANQDAAFVRPVFLANWLRD
jgi:WD40 repeat protein